MSVASTTSPAPPTLLVACLCAQWCGTCRDYGVVLEQVRQRFGAAVKVIFVDIEDDDAWLDGVEVENFPTVLIAAGAAVLFFGVITPQPQTLTRLVTGALAGDLRPSSIEPGIAELAQRLHRFGQA